MKHLLAIALVYLLSACGANPDKAYVQHPSEHSFVVDALGTTGNVEGYGATGLEAAYDAAAWMVTNVWTPNTPEYRVLVSSTGLRVVLVDQHGASYLVVAKLESKGLTLDAKIVQ